MEISHLHRTILPSAHNLVGDKVHTVYLIRVTRKIGLDLIRLQIPDLESAPVRECKEISSYRKHFQCGVLTRADEQPRIGRPR